MNSITATFIQFLINLVGEIGYLGIFLTMTMESAGIPIPSEVVVPFAGYLSVKGDLNFYIVIFLSTVANLIGSMILYGVGFKYGRLFVSRYGKYLLLEERHLNYVEKLFERYGSIIIFLGRLTPGVRTYISVVAGAGKMAVYPFLIYTLTGSFIWNFFLTYVGVVLGENWEIITPYLDMISVVAIIILIIIGILYIRRRAG